MRTYISERGSTGVRRAADATAVLRIQQTNTTRSQSAHLHTLQHPVLGVQAALGNRRTRQLVEVDSISRKVGGNLDSRFQEESTYHSPTNPDVLRKVPVERLQQGLGNRALARLFGETKRPPDSLDRRSGPYIKKVTVHLTPSQSADLEWEGSPPADAPGVDHFKVSTGKGYSDPDDPANTCTRTCCDDADKQCAPPWNQPTSVGACCTYFGNSFWTGTPLAEHNGWKWWTPIQPYYGSRGIALHQHTEVTGEPIGHGCVRMDEPNAHRIHDFSNGRKTNVTIDGRAAPVKCDDSRKCSKPSGAVQGGLEQAPHQQTVVGQAAVPGQEGKLS